MPWTLPGGWEALDKSLHFPELPFSPPCSYFPGLLQRWNGTVHGEEPGIDEASRAFLKSEGKGSS